MSLGIDSQVDRVDDRSVNSFLEITLHLSFIDLAMQRNLAIAIIST